MNKIVPYGGDKIIRNLICHIWPVKGRGVWQWNVAQLLRRMSLFNGQRIVSVVTDSSTDSFETVKAAFQGSVKDFYEYPNDPVLGETVSFMDMMRRVENIDPRQMTFYCHAKGVKYQRGQQPMVRRWTEVMYSHLLDYPELIEDSLRSNMLHGTFKKSGNQFGSLDPSWHFAGTFFWMRNLAVFGLPSWNRVPRTWWGTEAWPGIICQPNMAAHFHEVPPPDFKSFHLYAPKVWEDKIEPMWLKWQVEHAPLRRAGNYREILASLRLIGAKKVIVTGPQRSGTTIAAKILASDLKLPLVPEESFNVFDQNAFFHLTSGPQYVVQCPTMSAHVHMDMLKDAVVLWMRRPLKDILRSQERVDWQRQWEQKERDKYFSHDSEAVATTKIQAWERFQRPALGDRAFDLNYESLKGHPLWAEKEQRASFIDRQTSAEPSGKTSSGTTKLMDQLVGHQMVGKKEFLDFWGPKDIDKTTLKPKPTPSPVYPVEIFKGAILGKVLGLRLLIVLIGDLRHPPAQETAFHVPIGCPITWDGKPVNFLHLRRGMKVEVSVNSNNDHTAIKVAASGPAWLEGQ